MYVSRNALIIFYIFILNFRAFSSFKMALRVSTFFQQMFVQSTRKQTNFCYLRMIVRNRVLVNIRGGGVN
jgi:predicted membrane metal-binding protein